MLFKRKSIRTWPDVFARIDREFPEVRQIGTAELAEWLARDPNERPVLLDVRDADEFAVSHLVGARHVPPKADPKTALDGLSCDQPIVLYCAAGVRSSRMAKRLMDAGFTSVANLKGAIFQWANEDRPIEAAGQPATKVHGCDSEWAQLLRPDLRLLPS